MKKSEAIIPIGAIEKALASNDLSGLNPDQRVDYYIKLCDSLKLNPMTRPFEFIVFKGKTIVYARKDCSEQIRARDGISLEIMKRETVDGIHIVTVKAKGKDGREDESIGAVAIEGLKGEERANALMKCESKAKRRATLSIAGLGIPDESEIEDTPNTTPPAVTIENVKEKIKEAGGEMIEQPSKEPVKTYWKDVVIHVGKSKDLTKPDSFMFGKKLGEVPIKIFNWLVEKWLPKADTKTNSQNHILACALAEAQTEKSNDDKIPGLDPAASPASASEPEKAVDTPPVLSDAPQTPPAAKVSPTEKLIDWKEVKIPTGPGKGKKLGTLPDEGKLACYIYGVPKCNGDSRDEKLFRDGVSVMAGEFKYDQVPENIMRRKIMDRVAELGSNRDKLDAILGDGILEHRQTFVDCSADMVEHILNIWGEVEKLLK